MNGLPSPAARPSPAAASRRWLVVGAVVTVEYALLSMAFDAAALRDATGLARWIGRTGTVGPLVLAMATAALVLGGDRLRASLGRLRPAPVKRTAWLGAVHLALYAATWGLTARLFAPGADPAAGPMLAWVLVVLLVPASAFAAAFELAGLGRRLAPLLRPAAAAAAVGALAFGAALAAEQLWAPLARVTLHLAGGLLAAVTDGVVVDPAHSVLALDGFAVEIAPVCSGTQGIGLIVVVVGAFLVGSRARLRWPRALVLLPLAVGLVFTANALRIAVLVLVGARGSPDVALGGFHARAGWVLFCAVAVGVVAWARRSPWLARDRPAESALDCPSPTAAYLMPLLGLLAASMLTGLASEGSVDRLYGLRIVVAAGALWLYRHAYRPLARPSLLVGPLAGVAVYLIWLWLEPGRSAAGHALATELATLGAGERAAWLGTRVLGTVVIVPVVEELAFRGYALRRLVSRDFTQVPYAGAGLGAVLVSSVAFGALHQRFLAGMVAGAVFALAAQRRNRLADAIVAHAVANALLAAHVLLGGRFGLWS